MFIRFLLDKTSAYLVLIGAAGNLATKNICNMLEQMGYQTNIDLNRLNSIMDLCAEKLDAHFGGRMNPWLRKTN